ncbi:hypothetical protein DM01DRAFT_1332900 [Hesseltinella vesiculosa]|uniref:RING-type domain-containing protein n=1 Tax=Hesseltinella vesiculosa TaxID=101127 RepID=A0A1X2GQJ5_9FUNG|nr:hypothetical protein DM01DRAFT_1332900 [Hesseltinella vesiculosa]
MVVLEWLILLTIVCSLVDSQSTENPQFWQLPILFNASTANLVPIHAAARLARSPDFQVVFASNDLKIQYKRILVILDDTCTKNISLLTLEKWNQGHLMDPGVQDLPKMALVLRGNCTWKGKLDNLMTLSSQFNLNIDSMLIYDNDTRNLSDPFTMVSSSDAASYFINPPGLSADRNVSNMPDNDLVGATNATVPIAIYFAPFAYGNYLINCNKSSVLSNAGQVALDTPQTSMFYQMVPLFTGIQWQNAPGYENLWTTSRGYLAYVIALVLLFLIAIVLLRWWRVRKLTDVVQQQEQYHQTYIMHQRTHEPDPLPIDVIQGILVVTFTADRVKNASCAICLDDFVENKSAVRLLPCNHGFCVNCIDQWLSQKSCLCPICKYDCLPEELRQQRDQSRRLQSTTPDQPQEVTVVNMTSLHSDTSPPQPVSTPPQ